MPRCYSGHQAPFVPIWTSLGAHALLTSTSEGDSLWTRLVFRSGAIYFIAKTSTFFFEEVDLSGAISPCHTLMNTAQHQQQLSISHFHWWLFVLVQCFDNQHHPNVQSKQICTLCTSKWKTQWVSHLRTTSWLAVQSVCASLSKHFAVQTVMCWSVDPQMLIVALHQL